MLVVALAWNSPSLVTPPLTLPLSDVPVLATVVSAALVLFSLTTSGTVGGTAVDRLPVGSLVGDGL